MATRGNNRSGNRGTSGGAGSGTGTNKTTARGSGRKPSTIDLDPKDVKEVQAAAEKADATLQASKSTTTGSSGSDAGDTAKSEAVKAAGSSSAASASSGAAKPSSASSGKSTEPSTKPSTGKPSAGKPSAASIDAGKDKAATASKPASVPPSSAPSSASAKSGSDNGAKAKAEKRGGAGMGSMLVSALLGGAVTVGGLGAIGQTENASNLPLIGSIYSGVDGEAQSAATASLEERLAQLETSAAQDDGSADPTSRLAELETRIEALAASSGSQANQAGGADADGEGAAPDVEAVESLQADLAILQKTTNENVETIDQLNAQLASLTQSLNETGAADSGIATGDQALVTAGALAAATATIATLETRLDQMSDRISGVETGSDGSNAVSGEAVSELTGRVETLSGDVAGISEQLSAFEAGNAEISETIGVQGGQIAEVNEQLTAVSSQVAALDEAVNQSIPEQLEAVRATAENASASEAIARSVAASALRSAIENGDPLGSAIASVETLGGESEAINGLKALGEVPTVRTLVTGFDNAEEQVLNALREDPEGGVISQLMSNARGLVRVKPAGPVEGDTPQAILSRVGAGVQADDLDKVISEFETLPEAGQTAAAGWIEQVRARKQGLALVDQILADLSAGTNETDG